MIFLCSEARLRCAECLESPEETWLKTKKIPPAAGLFLDLVLLSNPQVSWRNWSFLRTQPLRAHWQCLLVTLIHHSLRKTYRITTHLRKNAAVTGTGVWLTWSSRDNNSGGIWSSPWSRSPADLIRSLSCTYTEPLYYRLQIRMYKYRKVFLHTSKTLQHCAFGVPLL